jgi:hypothetical protein
VKPEKTKLGKLEMQLLAYAQLFGKPFRRNEGAEQN